ncbi:MAG TPA: iron-sulfur cluster assembly scaffold protein [Dehalococcoidia bacterium]|nr:iron-sulfur cluster assembly scaffold protein [Dehalococcoidia bacterium]
MAEEAYSEIVLDHFQHPRNAGVLADPDAVGVTTNPVCGDTMKLMLRIDGDTIRAARWQTVGCPAAIATSSIATEMITGKDLGDVESLTREQIAEAAGGLPPSKLHCSVLAQDALRRAIRAYRAKASA